MNRSLLALIPLAAVLTACGPSVPALRQRPVEVSAGSLRRSTGPFNLLVDRTSGMRIALQGYDPVSYFPEGGGVPLRGDPAISARYAGVTYLFADPLHRAKFTTDPARYEPAYGGWCAWAMAQGVAYDVDPEHFLIQDDRLLLFYPGTEAEWQARDPRVLSTQAHLQWERAISTSVPAGRDTSR